MDNTYSNMGFAFFETNEIIKHFPVEYIKKIPGKFLNFIVDNQINNGFVYDTNKTLDKQDILRDTKIILSIIYRTYLCTAEKRKELEKEDYSNLQEKYDSNNVFKNYNKYSKDIKNDNNDIALVEYKGSFFKKIFNKIKSILKK